MDPEYERRSSVPDYHRGLADLYRDRAYDEANTQSRGDDSSSSDDFYSDDESFKLAALRKDQRSRSMGSPRSRGKQKLEARERRFSNTYRDAPVVEEDGEPGPRAYSAVDFAIPDGSRRPSANVEDPILSSLPGPSPARLPHKEPQIVLERVDTFPGGRSFRLAEDLPEASKDPQGYDDVPPGGTSAIPGGYPKTPGPGDSAPADQSPEDDDASGARNEAH